MRIKIILLNVLLLIFLFVLIYLYIYVNYNNNYENFVGEASVFLSTIDNVNQIQDISTSTTNANNTDTEKIDEIDNIPVNEEYIGMNPTYAFDNVADIMCQNRIVKLKKSASGISYGNGYYWINISSVGPKLIYLLTNEEIQNGGWLLAMRATKGSDNYNLVNTRKYLKWTSSSTDKKSKSQHILNININSVTRYNPELGLFRYNEDLKESFNISSIGNNIYTPNKIYDCKFDTFNEYMFKEIMVIFFKEKIDDSFEKKIGYLKIPNKELDNVSTLNNLFKLPDNSSTISFNSFKTTKNMELIYNFKMNIFNIQGGTSSTSQNTGSLSTYSPPITTINCLLGVQGTREARIENGINKPRIRYIYGIGVSNSKDKNIIKSSAVLIEIPDIINSETDISYFPLGFELYIK